MNSIYFNLVIEEYDKLNDKHITFQDLKRLVLCMPHLSYYSCILHDKDVGKRKHYHLNLEFDNSGYVLKSVLNKVASVLECNINCIQCISCSSQLFYEMNRYLIHIDDLNKYQYDDKEVISNDWKKFSNCLIGINPFNLDIAFLIYLVKSSDTIGELYSKLGLNFSNKYHRVISDLWKSKGSL